MCRILRMTVTCLPTTNDVAYWGVLATFPSGGMTSSDHLRLVSKQTCWFCVREDALGKCCSPPVGLMLEEGVVAGPEDIDPCMILGGGWPMFLDGVTPYWDPAGASERVNGKRSCPTGSSPVPSP
jgi:hypothetical protein